MDYIITEHDAISGETTVREMTADEVAQYETDKAAAPDYTQDESSAEEAPASDDAGAPSTDAG